ncbi:MAG: hypothetical protein K0S07_67 [Chlamydiales bacterium]|nr:hypothetical protein [Chlamydiales bacterium]
MRKILAKKKSKGVELPFVISAGVAQLVEHHLPKVRVVSSRLIARLSKRRRISCFFKQQFCGCSSVVEHHVANVRVVSSSLITRFFFFQFFFFLRV